MTTLTKLACAFVLAGGLAVPAFAATTGTPSPGSAGDPNVANGQSAMSNDQNDRTNGPTAGQNATTGQNAMHIGQRLRADLGKAGYTDITIMPSSFIVHAKDLQGNPVMMVVSPDFGHRYHGRECPRQFGEQLEPHGRQQRREHVNNRRRPTARADEAVKSQPTQTRLLSARAGPAGNTRAGGVFLVSPSLLATALAGATACRPRGEAER